MKIILLLLYKIVQMRNSDVYSVYSNTLGRYQRKRISSMQFMNFIERLAISTDSLPIGTYYFKLCIKTHASFSTLKIVEVIISFQHQVIETKVINTLMCLYSMTFGLIFKIST